MLSGITTLCFFASYSVALILEASRLFFRSGVRGAVMVSFAAAGFVAHTVFLANRAHGISPNPLSSPYDWLLVVAWMLVSVYLYEIVRQPKAIIGIFVLPVVLGLIGSAQFATRESFDQTGAANAWASVHSIFLLLGTFTLLVGFVAGVMYLVQADQLKRKRSGPQRIRLPSLEWLERVNARTLPVSTLLMTGGFLSGVILNQINDSLSWSDPAILGLALMLIWLFAATIFNYAYRPARRGRKVAYLTVAGFGFLAIALGTLLISETEHVMSHRRETGDAGASVSPRNAGRTAISRESKQCPGEDLVAWNVRKQESPGRISELRERQPVASALARPAEDLA